MLPVTVQAEGRVPLVDPHALSTLADQLENQSAARSFVRDFIQVWEERYLRLANAVERRDRAATLEAVLSVRTTSAMVGATRLAHLAAELEVSVRLSDLAEAAEGLPYVQVCGLQTIRELALCYEAGID